MKKKQPNLTPWFSGAVTPVRKGVYVAEFPQTQPIKSMRWFAYWDGRIWGWLSLDVDGAVDYYKHGQDHPRVKMKWRGLAEDPVAKTIRGIA